jgi:hypothetical protein
VRPFVKRPIDLAQYRDKLWKEIEACVLMLIESKTVSGIAGKVFGMAWPLLKSLLPDTSHETLDFS